MAPIRRYLRITAKSVLEVRIYLDDPADAHRWLLKPQDPALPRIIEAVRPLVLPKLREESENARRSGKRKGIKDVVKQGRPLLMVLLVSPLTTCCRRLRGVYLPDGY